MPENQKKNNYSSWKKDCKNVDWPNPGEIAELVTLASASNGSKDELLKLMTPEQAKRADNAWRIRQQLQISGPGILVLSALATIYSFMIGEQVLPEDILLATKILVGGGGALAGLETLISNLFKKRQLAKIRAQVAQRRGKLLA